MYSPNYAIETDTNKIKAIIRENSLATIIYQNQGEIESFPLPLILEGQTLVGHMALANYAWKALDNANLMAIFHGPHAYISPTWYGNGNEDVPTWNYISIQVKGTATIHKDESYIRKALSLLASKYDSSFDIDKNIVEHRELLQAIVGIEIKISDIFAKFKLGQRKSIDARKNVIAHLNQSSNSTNKAMAEAIRQTLT